MNARRLSTPRFLPLLAAALLACATTAQAQPVSQLPVIAFPYYNAGHVLRGLYGLHLPPLAQAFVDETGRLSAELDAQCGRPGAAPALQAQWLRVLLAWQALATPAVGPVLSRRSQRAIDFWPTRPALIDKALAQAPRTLDDLERIGTPAKGIPALEWLLRRPLNADTCAYAGLLSQGLQAEAAALAQEIAALATSTAQEGTQEAEDENPTVGPLFGEWVNQWLAGWERLRWAEIEQPVQKARTRQGGPEFARLDRATNLAEWRAQWAALKAQARVSPAQVQAPPQPNQALVPIEALLLGKGQMALAGRWARALDKVDARLAALTPQASTKELLALTQEMKSVTVLYQNEVAQALDVPLGFSEADGD